MAYVAWNDGVASTLDNGYPAPANRFGSWKPEAPVVGPRHHALGTGIPYVRLHRTEQRVTLVIDKVPPSRLDLALRLQLHLRSAGSCDVYTLDAGARAYLGLYLAEGGDIEISDPDENNEHTVTIQLMNPAGTRMLCVY
jgi:hypothetical protein